MKCLWLKWDSEDSYITTSYECMHKSEMLLLSWTPLSLPIIFVTINIHWVHFPGATTQSVMQSEKQSQSQPSPTQESENQIIPHTSPDITDDLRVLGKYSKLCNVTHSYTCTHIHTCSKEGFFQFSNVN